MRNLSSLKDKSEMSETSRMRKWVELRAENPFEIGAPVKFLVEEGGIRRSEDENTIVWEQGGVEL